MRSVAALMTTVVVFTSVAWAGGAFNPRRCAAALPSGYVLTDVSPTGWDQCIAWAVSNNGIVTGQGNRNWQENH